ncbi:2-acyl-glycerophospho-ethanolamine acyltransferase [Corynebacterium pseudopelargi]|uniref:2-acyl-glycerophospho-ethanolamine acyltransferase n=1 Tax=Corynebacterium pseudopelargi TaxID=2080757 RepID=A0A3G6ITF6_9CORY|nr:2-acyl-glycerophospho-ethanolamine acyltransferase [Corynebacterium pseudopelargi]
MRILGSANIPNKWYWVFKHVLIGPWLKVLNRPEVEHIERIPNEGPAILASNHQAVMDSFYFPLVCERQLTFPAKSEYFTGTSLVGKLQKWFFTSVGQMPIERGSAEAGDQLLEAATKVLDNGDLFGIYPEGTRSPDGRVYKGKSGMARIALLSGVDVIPVAMIDTRKANPIGSWIPRPAKVRMKIGKPIAPRAFVEEAGLDPDSYEAARYLTDHVMHVLADLVGVEYVDMYASEVKASLEAGKGYPEGI